MAKEEKTLNAKQMLLDSEGVVFRYKDRKDVEYVADYGSRKPGDVATHAKFKSDWLIKNGIAKDVK